MSDIPRCATCSHWNRDMPVGNERCNQHYCEILSLSRGCNVFDANKSAVYTPPDFGCVLHHPKDESAS